MFNFSWFKSSSNEDAHTSTWNPNTLAMDQPSSPAAPAVQQQQQQQVETEQPVSPLPASLYIYLVLIVNANNIVSPPRNQCRWVSVVEMATAAEFAAECMTPNPHLGYFKVERC